MSSEALEANDVAMIRVAIGGDDVAALEAFDALLAALAVAREREQRSVQGWYGPPQSRRFHYFGEDGRSLCGEWLVVAWSEELGDVAIGPANGDCASCKGKLAARGGVSPSGKERGE